MVLELQGTDSVIFCGNCREQIMLCVVGILGNRFCLLLWELQGKIVICVVGIVGNR